MAVLSWVWEFDRVITTRLKKGAHHTARIAVLENLPRIDPLEASQRLDTLIFHSSRWSRLNDRELSPLLAITCG